MTGTFENSTLSIGAIQKAYAKLRGVVLHTPLIYSEVLSELIHGEVYLKLENTQLTHSFKARGAYIKLCTLSDGERARGVVTASAGNHAKAVAYHCHKQGIQATVVMPTTAPQNKIEYCESKGARVLFHGAHLAEAFPKAEELAEKQGLVMIHPYDDYHVMAGQGTLGLELVEDMHKPLDVVIIPVGGGGLSAGMGTALKHHWPHCTIYGVQTEFAPNMAVDLFGYVPETCEVEGSIAEGIAVKRPGRLTKPILKNVLKDIFVVKESMIARAMHDLLIHEKQVVEGAGAAGVAAVLTSPDIFHGKRVGIILCGGNVDAEIVGQVAV